MFRRLKDERGFSLLELQVAELIGGFVITAAISMMIIAINSSNRVTDRVNAAQVGRTAMEQIQQRLRSQTCLFPLEYSVNGSTSNAGAQASIVHASNYKLVFFGDLGATGGSTAATGSVGFAPQMRFLYLATDATGRRGRFVEGWRSATTNKAPYNFNVTPATSIGALANETIINLVPPTTRRGMADGITSIGPTSPIFTYFNANDITIAVSGAPIGGVPTAELGNISRINVSFKVLGLTQKDNATVAGSTAVEDVRTASFVNDIYLRTVVDRCQ